MSDNYFLILPCQKEESSVCFEVLHTEARTECSWLPDVQ